MKDWLSNIEHQKIFGIKKDILEIDTNNLPTARDVLAHFNKHLYPSIEKKHKAMLDPTKRTLLSLFGKKIQNESDIYKQRGIASSKKMTEFVIGNDTNNIARIKLLLEIIRLEMDRAYANVYLDYSNCADKYIEEGEQVKANIIKNCLHILSKRFRDWVATITIWWEYITIETRKEKTIIHKDDFFKKFQEN